MTKRRKRIDSARAGQLSLFDLVVRSRKCEPEQSDEGSLKLTDRLRTALNQALKECPLSRWEVAGKMSHLLGIDISKYQIDSWTAESKNGHRIPAEYLPAFCRAVSSPEPLRILAEASGLFVLQGPDALRSEIRKLEEESRRIGLEKKKRIMFLYEMEKK